jgi:hypothetical protein
VVRTQGDTIESCSLTSKNRGSSLRRFTHGLPQQQIVAIELVCAHEALAFAGRCTGGIPEVEGPRYRIELRGGAVSAGTHLIPFTIARRASSHVKCQTTLLLCSKGSSREGSTYTGAASERERASEWERERERESVRESLAA